jgi:predicted Zn-dependent protease
MRDQDRIDPDLAMQRLLEDVLRQRYLVMAMNLAARKGAEPVIIKRLLKYLDKGIESDADDGRWKLSKASLLVALDRPKELEQTLRQWTRDAGADSRWRIMLGYLLAEQGRVAEAIGQFEIVEKEDELGPSAYASLAEWHLVQGQKEAHERAALAVYKTIPERQLSRMIWAKLSPWRRGDAHLPTQLDKEVFRMFAVLFEKSASPHSYLEQLREFYEASRDSRFLAVLPDAVLGHTVEQIYPFVQGMHSILDEVRDEAAADELVKRIGEVRSRAKSDVDRRALDLLEAQVERRAAELKNQPGPHLDRALKAMQQAFKRAWSPGEPRLMADYLAGLGKISQPALAEEQLRQLKDLRADSAKGSLDRLHIAHQFSKTLHGQGRGGEAVDVLETALGEFTAPLPVVANGPLGSFVAFLESAGHFARGEKFLLNQIERPIHAQQRRWLIEQLDHLYHHALQNKGEVSLGKGVELYRALNARIQKDLADTDEAHRYQLISLQCAVFATADRLKLAGVKGDLKSFTSKVLPPLLKRITNNHEGLVNMVAGTVYDLAGPREGLVFLLDEIDNEPRWLRYVNQDGWSRQGGSLAKWHSEAKDAGAVEGRLLKLTLLELRRDLETRQQRNRSIYYELGQAYFWKAKEADFAKVAEEVLAQHNQSEDSVRYIAEYFFWGLGRHPRAIEILLAANAAQGKKLLGDDGQAQLVTFLQFEKRYAESIPLLQPLTERRPGEMHYRVQLMRAFFRTERKAELLALLKQTDAFFHEKDRWGETPLHQLAQSTLENELFDQSVAYAKELIALHEETHANRGIGNGVLSSYYGGLARAYAGLKQTHKAVEAAGAAVVAWGGDSKNRTEALKALKDVLLNAPDLDKFVAEFDAKKQDGAIIRRALGEVYAEKKEYANAIKQLALAVALQPNDVSVHRLLLDCCDGTGDKEGAIGQLLQTAQVLRRDLKLYQDLGDRYTKLGRAAQAERAFTSIVEMLPTEAESHALLAEIREKQNRWSDAIEHWKQVARLQALEPTGLLKLAAAQIHEKQVEQAQETLDLLRGKAWPARFTDLGKQIRSLEANLGNR